MKKVLFVAVLFMTILVVNAQTPKASVISEKSVRATVELADLQKTITDNVAKDFAGFAIKEAASVTTNDVVTYEVTITKEALTETLVYDKAGVFVRKNLQVPVKE